MITEVRLHNWRSHEDTQLEFTKGTNLLVGIMGSGKSSVLEAICYGLFGKFPALASRKVKLNQIHSKFAKDNQTYVEVKFKVNDKEYTVKRVIENGKSTAELREGQKLLEAKSEGVTRYVEGLLGIDYDLYVRAIYAEQNSIDYFLNISPSERKKQIDNLMGIDRYEKLRGITVKAMNRIKDWIKDRENSLQKSNKTELKEEYDKLKGELERIETEITENNKILEDSRKREHELRKKVTALKEMRDKYERTKLKLEGLAGKLDQIRKNIKNKSIEEKQSQEELINKLESSLKEEKEKLQRIQNKIVELNRDIAVIKNIKVECENKTNELKTLENRMNELNLEEDTASLNEKIQELRKNKEKITSEISNLRVALENKKSTLHDMEEKCKKHRELSTKLKELRSITHRDVEDLKQKERNMIEWMSSLKELIKINNEAIQQLNQPGSVCPVCESPLSEEKRKELITRKTEQIKGSEEEMKTKEKELSEIRSRIDRLEKQLKEKEFIEKELKEIGDCCDKVDPLKEEIAEMDSKITSIKEDEIKINDKLHQLEETKKRAEEYMQVKIKILEIKDYLKENEPKIGRLEELVKELGANKEEENRVLKKIEEIEQSREKARTELREIVEDINRQEELKKYENEYRSYKSELESIQYNPEELERIESDMNETMGRIREVRSKIEGMKKLEESVKANISTVESRLREIEELEKDIETYNKLHERLAKFGDSVVEAQAALRTHLVDAVNDVLKRVWNSLYPYKDITAVRLEATENDYRLMMERRGEWTNLDGNVSGGERASAALALRIALSIVLVPNLSLIVLDEPTHNLDSNGVRALSEILRDKLPSIVEQAFVITHDEGLKEGASGKLYIFSREKGRYEPTKVLMEEIM